MADLAVDARDLVETLGLTGERLAQQPRVKLEPAERIAHLVRDTGQHHLHALVARAQRRPRLLQRLRQHADLVAVSIGMRPSRSPGPRRSASLRQARDGSGDAARQPDGQQQDGEQRDDAGADHRSPQRRERGRIVRGALDRDQPGDVPPRR